MKKIFTLMIALVLVLSLAACGDKDPAPSGGGTTAPGTSQQGGEETNGSGIEIEDVSVDNWAQVVSGNFGLDLALPDGWSVSSAKSHNNTSNVEIVFTIAGDVTADAFGQEIFDELKADAVGDIYKNGDPEKTYASFADAVSANIASIKAKLNEDGTKYIQINYFASGDALQLTINRSYPWE